MRELSCFSIDSFPHELSLRQYRGVAEFKLSEMVSVVVMFGAYPHFPLFSGEVREVFSPFVGVFVGDEFRSGEGGNVDR